MRYRITHKTSYTGDQPVSVCHNEAWLKPRSTPFQCCDDHQLATTPSPTSLSHRRDYFDNDVWAFSFNRGYDSMTVTAISEVTLCERNASSAEASRPWEEIVQRLAKPATPDDLSASEFTFDSPRIPSLPQLTDYASESFPAGRPLVEGVASLTERIFRDFAYDPRATTVTTPVEEVFRLRKGVCQDFAHLEIAALRALGLGARYVSGYLRTRPAPGKPRLVGADASHAWLAVYLGDGEWLDFDPTNNILPNLEHITVAWGRDYSDVCPLKGVFIGGGRHSLNVSVDVAPIDPEDAEQPSHPIVI